MKGRKKRVRYTILKKIEIFKQSHAWSMCLHLPSPISCFNNTEAATWPYGSKCPHLTARRSHQSQTVEFTCSPCVCGGGLSGLQLSPTVYKHARLFQKWPKMGMWVWMVVYLSMDGRIQMYWIEMDGWNNTYMLGVMHVHHLALLTTKTSH